MVTVTAVVKVDVSVLSGPSYTSTEMVYVAVMVVAGMAHWGMTSRQGAWHDAVRVLGLPSLQTSPGSR